MDFSGNAFPSAPGSPATEPEVRCRNDVVCGRYDVRRFGAVGDGVALDTGAINLAVATAHREGGGTVVFPAGNYLSYSIRLQSHVSLVFESGATLIAANPPLPGETGGYDAPEECETSWYQDFGHSHFRNSLIWGENLEGVALYGPGRIFGRGLSRGNGRIALPVGIVAPQPPGHLPDVLEADGPVDREGETTPETGPFGYPNPRDTLPPGVGNKAIGLRGCRGVVVRDLTLLHCGHFALLVTDCDNVTVDNVFIDTNRDGIDIDACRNVRISNCSVNSPWDDGICIKSSCGFGGVKPVENVTVSNCYVSGFEEGTLYNGSRSRKILHRGGPIGRIKLGTEASGGFRNVAVSNCVFEFCRGLALEQVDGACMEDIVVSNLSMREVMNAPIFIRVGGRLRAPQATVPGPARRILISNVVAADVAKDHGIFISGLADQPVRGVSLTGIRLQQRGGGTRSDAERLVPEMRTDYPEPMLFGTLPAWGLYARHVADLEVSGLTLELMTTDARPAVMLDNVAAADFRAVRLPVGADATSWQYQPSAAIRIRDCDGIA